MDPLAILQLALTYGPAVKALWDEASSNADLVTKIKQLSQPLANLLQDVGTRLFPQAAPQIAIVGGVIAAFDPNTTKWLQGALNTLLSPSPNLVVDGLYGPLTRDAVSKLQAKLGLKVDGLAGQITQAAIASALANLPTIK